MATVDVSSLVSPTYTPTLLVPTDGSTFTQALLTNLIVSLANRTEFLRDLSFEASDTPGAYARIREDFFGAIFTAGQNRLDASFPWRCVSTGNVSINGNAGSSKNPGQLRCSIPGDGVGDQYFGFHIESTTGAPFSYATFQQLEVTVAITEDPANLNEQIRFGLVDDAEGPNGGSDSLVIWRAKAVNATKWMLLKRVGGVQTSTVLTAADFVDGEFAVWRMVKNATSGIDFYLNGDLVHTVASGDLPSGGCNISFLAATSVADTEVLQVDWDLIDFRSKPNDRSGA